MPPEWVDGDDSALNDQAKLDRAYEAARDACRDEIEDIKDRLSAAQTTHSIVIKSYLGDDADGNNENITAALKALESDWPTIKHREKPK